MKDIRFLTRWGFGLALSLVVLLHLLKPDLNPLTRHISEYANGRFGFIMILAFLFFAFGLLGISFQSYRIIAGQKMRILIPFLFLLSAFSSVILGLFPLNSLNTPITSSALIHLQTAPILISSMFLGLICITYKLKKEPTFHPNYKLSVAFGIAAGASAILLVFFAQNPNYQGLVQRLFALIIWLWLSFISLKIA